MQGSRTAIHRIAFLKTIEDLTKRYGEGIELLTNYCYNGSEVLIKYYRDSTSLLNKYCWDVHIIMLTNQMKVKLNVDLFINYCTESTEMSIKYCRENMELLTEHCWESIEPGWQSLFIEYAP